MADNFSIIDSTESVKQIDAIISKTNDLSNAWNELLPKVQAVNSEFAKGKPKEYTEALKLAATYSKQLEKVNKDLTDAQVRLQKVEQESAKTKQQLAKAAYEEQRAKNASLRTQNTELSLKQRIEALDKKEQQRLAASASLYSKIETKLKALQLEYRDLASAKEIGIKLTDKESSRLEFLKGKIEKYDTTLKAVDATMGKHQRNVGNYAGSFNSLNASLSQITREMPAFANSAQTGFMAISNNIPIFFDAISKVKDLNKELQAQGKPTTSVLKQLAGALFSWQTLLPVGVTLLTVYGADIWKWAKSLYDGAKAIDKAKLSQQSLNEAVKDADYKKAVRDISEMTNNIELAKKGFIDKEKALKFYNETLGKVMGTATSLNEAEMILTKNADNYIKATLYKAAANLALDKSAEQMLKAEEARRKKLEEFNNSFLDASIENVRTEAQYKAQQDRIANNRKRRQKEEIKLAEDNAKAQKSIAMDLMKTAAEFSKGLNFDTILGLKEKTDKKNDRGSRLSGEQRDYLMTLQAQRDNELTIQRKLLYDKKINEEKYWSEYKNIVTRYRDAVDAYLQGKNAKEKLVDAETKKKALEEVIKANDELFKLEKERLDKTQTLNEKQNTARINAIKNDDYLSEVGRLEEQISAYNDLYEVTNKYYDDLIAKAKETKQLQSEINNIEIERQSKLTDLAGKRDVLFSGFPEASTKDINRYADFEKSLQGLTFEQQKQLILSNKKLDNENRSYLLSKLENQNSINENNIEIKRLENLRNQLSVRIAIAKLNGQVNPKDIQQLSDYERQITNKQNENKGLERAGNVIDAERLKSQLSPIKNIISQGLGDLGLGNLSNEFDGLFNAIINKAKNATDTFSEIWKEGFNLVGEYGKILVEQQTQRQIAALDLQLESSKKATEQEIGFINKRLEYFSQMQDMTEEQIAERNALEDEARTYREQQEQREKQIAKQKAKAQQRASAMQTLISGAQGSIMAYSSQLIPGDPTSPIRGYLAAAATMAFSSIMAGLIMSKNPVPQYYIGRDGGRAEWAYTQERGAEAISDKSGRIKTWGNSNGAQLTWLEDGDTVHTASETLALKRNMEQLPELNYQFYRNASVKGINPIIVKNPDNSDKIINGVGKEFERVQRKFDKTNAYEDENGNLVIERGNRIPEVRRKKQKPIVVNIQKTNTRD